MSHFFATWCSHFQFQKTWCEFCTWCNMLDFVQLCASFDKHIWTFDSAEIFLWVIPLFISLCYTYLVHFGFVHLEAQGPLCLVLEKLNSQDPYQDSRSCKALSLDICVMCKRRMRLMAIYFELLFCLGSVELYLWSIGRVGMSCYGQRYVVDSLWDFGS